MNVFMYASMHIHTYNIHEWVNSKVPFAVAMSPFIRLLKLR